MQTLEIMLRTLLGAPFFFFLPGYMLDRGWLAGASAVRGVERQISRIVASVLLTGWIALVLASFGVFSFWLLLAITVVLCAGGWWRIRTKRAAAAAPALGIIAGGPTLRTLPTSWRGLFAALTFDRVLLLIMLVFAILVARPFEVVRGGLDAGVYANTGIAIARTGGIVQYDPIVAELGQRAAAGDASAQQLASNILGVQRADRYIATRYRAAGFFINDGELATGRIVPQFFHLWPTWIAVFVSMLGPAPGLVVTGAAGTLGVVLLGLLGRRIGGSTVGLLAASFLALMTPQVWFSRMSTSEALAQALLLAGLWAWTHFADATNRRERIWWGAIIGAAFGQMTLTRIDGVFAPAITLLLLGYVAYTRRWHAGYSALAAVLGAMLVHTALHIIFISRAYFFDTAYITLQKLAITIYLSLPFLSPGMAQQFKFRGGSRYTDPYAIWLELIVLALLIIGLILLWRRPRPFFALEAQAQHWRRWLLAGVVVVLSGLALYGYLIRPGILTRDVLLHPFSPANWLRLQGYVGAPIEIPQLWKKTFALDLGTMARFGWYMSPLGVVLGVVGGLLLWWRLNRRTWLLLLIATAYALFYFRSLYGTGDQTYIYILRRYVPLVYPAFALSSGYALVALASVRARSVLQRIASGASVLGASALLLFFAVTGRTVYQHIEYAGTLAQIDALAQNFQPQDVILVRGGGAGDVAVRDTSEVVATPLTYVFGNNALPVKGNQPAHYAAAFADQVTRWRSEGRKVYLLLAASGGDLLFPGYALRSVDVWTLQQREFQQLQNQKPKLSYVNEVPFHLYELVPNGSVPPATTFSYNDTAAQVAGFYRSEQQPGQPRAAWTNGLGILRVPSSNQGQTLTLDVAGGVRPAAIGPARLCIEVVAEPVPYPQLGVNLTKPRELGNGSILQPLPWQELQCATLTEAPSSIKVALPATAGTDTRLVRLRSTPWIPAQVTSSPDERSLGVRFLRATLTP